MKLLKHFLLFTLFFFLFPSTSFSQWWQSGGNLIWPYGNVEITNGNLDVNGNLTVTATFFSILPGSDWSFFFQGGTSSPNLTFGDTNNEDNYLQLNDNGFYVQQIKTVLFGDWNDVYNGTFLSVDIENSKIILKSSLIQFPVMETDSTRCISGDLWMDSTGVLHRKF